MWIADGIQLINSRDKLAAIEHLENVVYRGGVLHVVDMYAKPDIATTGDILRELALTLGVAEWYGYEPVTIFQQAISAYKPQVVHVVVLCLLPKILKEVMQTITPALASATSYALRRGRRFYVCLFDTPLASPSSRL